jgi:ferrochelatase
MRYLPEPPHRHGKLDHGAAARTGVLLINLGTPDAPDRKAVRRYLAEFLSDPRVIEIPMVLWKVILHGVILNVRPKDSAKRYASIWTPEGSPLLVWTQRQTALTEAWLAEQGHDLPVYCGMRYGNPSIASVLTQMRADGIERILAVPLYPQYAASSTATAIDAVGRWLARARNQPEVRYLRHFHDDAGYIEALAARVEAFWAERGRAKKLVLSFHGVPMRSLELGDPYHCECHKTGRLLAERLGLAKDAFEVTFQSRFGAAEWLQPYTEPTLTKLAAEGEDSVDVFCPGFVGDCLETLEEIAEEAREAYLKAGGKDYRYIPALNDTAPWIDALGKLILSQVQGWPTLADVRSEARAAERATQRERALHVGAID